MCRPVGLSVGWSVDLPVCRSVPLSIRQSGRPSVCRLVVCPLVCSLVGWSVYPPALCALIYRSVFRSVGSSGGLADCRLVRLTMCLPDCLSGCRSACLLGPCRSACSVCLSVGLSIWSVCLSLGQASRLLVCRSIRRLVGLSVYLSGYRFVCPYVC